MQKQQAIRLSLPSKGRLQEDSLSFLSLAGLSVFKPNPRQYQAEIPALPELGVLFQRPGDIVVSVRQGSVDFGITGIDVIEEKRGENGDILILHDALGFGGCSLTLRRPGIMEGCKRYFLAQRICQHARPSLARCHKISHPHRTFPRPL